MSEICEVCGRGACDRDATYSTAAAEAEAREDCYRLGYERALARADRLEAEFCACKALLIAAQNRGERAEAERAEWKDRDGRDVLSLRERLNAAQDAYAKLREETTAAEQKASEARAALERAREFVTCMAALGHVVARGVLAEMDAALPVEPRATLRDFLAELRERTFPLDALPGINLAVEIAERLAALPVEPARLRELQENDQKAGTVVPTPLTRGES